MEQQELDLKLKKIKAIITDIDGVLTNGCVGYGADDFIKFFNYRDGHWIKMAMREGILVGFLSGRQSRANAKRAAELGVSFCLEDIKDKRSGFLEVLEKYQLAPEECLYIGDDIIDLPVLLQVGVPVTPADGLEFFEQELPLWRTSRAGGCGVLQEVIERLLRVQGLWDKALARYRNV